MWYLRISEGVSKGPEIGNVSEFGEREREKDGQRDRS